MRIDRFQMERTQSLYEHDVEYNLSESGVQPLTVTELLGEELDATALGALALRYPESNGSPLLRERIATFYPGAARENVLVTACAEARLANIPEFVRPTARTGIERFARERGALEVDEKILDAARDFFGM